MSFVIQTERLDLIPLTPVFLRAVLRRDIAQAAQELGFAIHGELPDYGDVASMRLEQLEAEPAYQPWSLRAMVLREQRLMIGRIGFHTAPAPEYLQPFSPGGVEFGFMVEPPFRRQGYAREASIALMRWARREHSVTNFVLSIQPANDASQGLATDLGFVRIGSHIDDVDGLEDVLERKFELGESLYASSGNG